MQLSCIHCGYQFTITSQQLGGRGRCPRCSGEIELPRLSDEPEHARPHPFAWMENSISALGSCVFHMILLLVLALFVTEIGGTGFGGEGELVQIGLPEAPQLTQNNSDQLSPDNVETEEQAAMEELEISTPVDASANSLSEFEAAPSPTSAVGGGSFQLSPASASGGGSGQGFDNIITQLRRDGLDIVFCFDSTGSMGGEIGEVKNQIKRIGNALQARIPKTRISICTYRDTTDAYTVIGQPLDDDIQRVANYLSDITAGGGGDMPEAVQEGMKWSVKNNEFKSSARKVMLIFGDAPPHPEDMKACTEIASDFSSQQGGIVSTVTCRARNGAPLPEFVEIAQAGGGEAFLTTDERQIMKRLLVLVFGSKYRDAVLKAFGEE
jgi:hypothetical protein